MENVAINLTDYKIQETIHETLLTIVVRAIRLSDNKEVVIKTLKDTYPSPNEIARLKREYGIAKKISSSGIIEMYNLETYGQGNVAIIMELFAESIDKFLLKEKRFTMDRFFAVVPILVRILGKSHYENVIHKDINPRNILLDSQTNKIKIIDFGISSELSRERQSLNVSERLEGSLPYISPEQTGRMNRELDYRTDYYSLGVTLFEMITGQLPFEAEDMMGWVYSHISKNPTQPSKINPEIPEAIEAIILKLMAKNAEDRYQSSYGLLKDIDECRKQWSKNRKIENFQPGKWDISEQFQIPQKMYGREKEVESLMSTFDKVVRGNTELLLVSGYSGVGKSALVHEVQKPIVQKRGYFIEGKFDQFQKNIPYKAISQAFRNLTHQLMAETEEKLNIWREKLLKSFGPNGQIVLDMIPDLESIVDKQPPVQELGPTESQNRFKIVFHDFIKVFADLEHPLVIFLDDLQWSDPPTLNLLRHWMESADLPYLFIIAAYRDNEVGESHPLRLSLDAIGKIKRLHNLILKPLSETSVNQIVVDTLHSNPQKCLTIAKLLHQKTEGNPFFVNELFKNLYQEEAIWFNRDKGCWEWEIESIKQAETSGNVVEFMIKALHKLSPTTRRILQLAACIGNTFDLKTLSIIHEKSIEMTSIDLFEALKSGLIAPLSEDYKFVAENDLSFNPEYQFQQDRVQQAAYSLIDENKKPEVHLSIGRLMLSNLNKNEQEEKLIDILRQLNEGQSLITDDKEKEKLVRLNLKAGIRAKDATAYQVALEYIKIGNKLLGDNPWKEQYELILPLYMEYCQCAYLVGEIDEAENLIVLMLKNVKTNLEKVEILYIQSRQYSTLGKYKESIQAGLQSLALLGINIPNKPNPFFILKEFFVVKWNMRKKKISALLNLPEMVDNEKKLAIRSMMELISSTYLTGNKNLLSLLIFKMMNLSLRFGNTTYSAFTYMTYGYALTSVLGNMKDGYEFGKLGVNLNEKYKDKSLECRILMSYNTFIHHWNEHWETLTPGYQKSVEAGFQSGDFLYLGHSSNNVYLYNPKLNLNTKIEYLKKSIVISKSIKYDDSLDTAILLYQYCLNLCGLTDDSFSMNTTSFSEDKCLDRMQQRKYVSGLRIYQICKSEIFFIYEEYEDVFNYIVEIEKDEEVINGTNYLLRFCVISFFICSALYLKAETGKKKDLKKRINKSYKQMKKWSDHCPVNFLHLYLAMEAELARLSGKSLKAEKYYNDAAEKAKEGGWQQDEGMILVLAGKFYLSRGLKREAAIYMQEAYLVYKRWGATRKLEFMKEKYQGLLEQKVFQKFTLESTLNKQTLKVTSTENSGQFMDLGTVSKASQTLSGEVHLEKLLKKLMNIVCENAGAEKGILLLKEKTSGKMIIQAERKENGETTILTGEYLKDKVNISKSIVQYVKRSEKEVVLTDASQEGDFIKDIYIQSEKPKSVLCTTIMNQGRLVGILYLENNKVTGAFTPQRLEVLKILSTQAAISIENALLYENLEDKVKERTEKLSIALQKVEEESQKSEKLLLNILPNEVAIELKEKGYYEPIFFESVSVLFTDFKGFTQIAEHLTPQMLVKELDLCFGEFDEAIERYDLEKLKTIGDSYMCASGIPRINTTHAIDCVLAAMEFLLIMNRIKELKALTGKPFWELRIGIHSGPLVAGVIGEKKFAYDVWGDTVNTASRMESSGTPGKINISGATYERAKEFFECEFRGKVQAKNKGEVEMYYVNGLKPKYSKDGDGKTTNVLFWKEYSKLS
ncbi:MAG: AAA family ATPase [Leptospiraceae bacterium]|nr:AAA family ATPase [Leptospiraceae bacterium]